MSSDLITGYKKDIRLEQQFAETMKMILGRYFIRQDVEADLHSGTDFAVFTIKPFRVAARLRRFQYYGKYSQEFTIRWTRPNGIPTEIDKLRAGLVDYLFYGFVNKEETKLQQYFIGDLAIFLRANIPPFAILPNSPHDSDLAVYRIRDFPKGFIKKLWVKV